MLKNSNETVEILNYECDKQSYFSLVDDLLLTIQNVVSGIASISKHIINNTYCEFHIHLSTTLPLVILRYKLGSNSKDDNSEVLKSWFDNQTHFKLTEYDFKKLISVYNSNILYPVSKLINNNKERDTSSFIKSRYLTTKEIQPVSTEIKYKEDEIRQISSVNLKEKTFLQRKPLLYNKAKSHMNADNPSITSEISFNNAEIWSSNSWTVDNKKSFVDHFPASSNALKLFEAEKFNQMGDKMKNQIACNIKPGGNLHSTYIISDNVDCSSSDTDENSNIEESDFCKTDTLQWVNQQKLIDYENEYLKNEENRFHEINTLPVMCILNESADENEDISSISVNSSENLETNKNEEAYKMKDKIFGHEENNRVSFTEQCNKTENNGSTIDRPHSCSYCKKTFVHLNHKKQHERTHTGEKPYSCSYCEKRFSQMSSRDRHEKVHTGEKPYLCSYCGKLFNSVGNKNKHEKIHTGERPYNCQFCGKPFISRDKKDLHEKTHSGEKPHQCSFCEKSFTSVRGKQEHEMIHLGKKLYSCRHCKKTFNSASNKSKHEKRHFGKIPYFCHLCNKSFPWPVNKKNHKKECSPSKNDKSEKNDKEPNREGKN